MPWRKALVRWPDSWREQWGRLANELETERGLPWRDAERIAFDRVRASKQPELQEAS